LLIAPTLRAGRPLLIAGFRLADAPPMRLASPAAVLFLVLGIGGCAPEPPAVTTVTEAAARLRTERPGWLLPHPDCAADVVPAVDDDPPLPLDVCEGDPTACVQACEAGSAHHCYALAIAVETLLREEAVVRALYYRACELGRSSACTNFAASDPEDWSPCIVATYEAACRARDPWGCTMFGTALALGAGIEADPERALRILPQGCRFGEDDPACRAARRRIAELSSAPAPREASAAVQD
jgi:hypothetical protein